MNEQKKSASPDANTTYGEAVTARSESYTLKREDKVPSPGLMQDTNDQKLLIPYQTRVGAIPSFAPKNQSLRNVHMGTTTLALKLEPSIPSKIPYASQNYPFNISVFSGPHYQPEKYAVKTSSTDDLSNSRFFLPEQFPASQNIPESTRYLMPTLDYCFQNAFKDGSYFESYSDYNPQDPENFRHAFGVRNEESSNTSSIHEIEHSQRASSETSQCIPSYHHPYHHSYHPYHHHHHHHHQQPQQQLATHTVHPTSPYIAYENTTKDKQPVQPPKQQKQAVARREYQPSTSYERTKIGIEDENERVNQILEAANLLDFSGQITFTSSAATIADDDNDDDDDDKMITSPETADRCNSDISPRTIPSQAWHNIQDSDLNESNYNSDSNNSDDDGDSAKFKQDNPHYQKDLSFKRNHKGKEKNVPKASLSPPTYSSKPLFPLSTEGSRRGSIRTSGKTVANSSSNAGTCYNDEEDDYSNENVSAAISSNSLGSPDTIQASSSSSSSVSSSSCASSSSFSFHEDNDDNSVDVERNNRNNNNSPILENVEERPKLGSRDTEHNKEALEKEQEKNVKKEVEQEQSLQKAEKPIPSKAATINKCKEWGRFLQSWRIKKRPSICTICMDPLISNDDASVIYCDSPQCDVLVHRMCLNRSELPFLAQNCWLCDKCFFLDTLEQDVRFVVTCALCPNTNGLLCKLSPYLHDIPWVHFTCAKIFEVNPGDFNYQPDLGEYEARFDLIPIDSFKKTCVFCTDKIFADYGAKLSCSECGKSFHVSCAQMNGVHVSLKTSNAVCLSHSNLSGTTQQIQRSDAYKAWIQLKEDYLLKYFSKDSRMSAIDSWKALARMPIPFSMGNHDINQIYITFLDRIQAMHYQVEGTIYSKWINYTLYFFNSVYSARDMESYTVTFSSELFASHKLIWQHYDFQRDVLELLPGLSSKSSTENMEENGEQHNSSSLESSSDYANSSKRKRSETLDDMIDPSSPLLIPPNLQSPSQVCSVCKRTKLPVDVCDNLGITASYLKGLKETKSKRPYGFTGKGWFWDPRVFIQCSKCQSILHCGCPEIPIKNFPERNKVFICILCDRQGEMAVGPEALGGSRRIRKVNYKE